MNIHEDELAKLGPAFTHALASVLNTREVDHGTAIRANDYINQLQSTPRGIEVMLWLLANFTTVDVPDPTYFLFAVLNTLARAILNAKAATNGPAQYDKKWLAELKRARDFIDGQLFGEPREPALAQILNTILSAPFICAKFQQIMGLLYVPFRLADWKNLNKFILEHYGPNRPAGATVPVTLVNFLAGALSELCSNLNNDRAASSFVQKKIDKAARLTRVSDISQMLTLMLRDTGGTAVTAESARAYTVVCRLFEEFTSLLVAVQLPKLLEDPLHFHFELFVSPQILSSQSTVLAATESLLGIVQNVCATRVKRELFCEHLSTKFQGELLNQAITALKLILDSRLTTALDWEDSELLTIFDRLVTAVGCIVEKCQPVKGQVPWRQNLMVLYVVLVALHIPHQQIFVKAVGTLARLLDESGSGAEESEEARVTARQLSGSLETSASNGGGDAQIEPLLELAFKTVLYRLIRVTDLPWNEDDLAQTFVDRATAQLISSNLKEKMGIKAENFADLVGWRNSVIAATTSTDDSEDDEVKTLLSAYSCSIRAAVKTLVSVLANGGGRIWQLFETTTLAVLGEWTNNELFRSSLIHRYNVPSNLSIKLKGFISPCFTLIDALGNILQIFSEVNHPLCIQLGEQTLAAFVKTPLTWIDSHVTVLKDASGATLDYQNLDPQRLGSHWHWIEWRRLEVIKNCANLTLAARSSLLLEHLLKRIYLEVPEPWLEAFPVGECDGEQEDVFYLTRRKSYQSLARIFTHSISIDQSIATAEVEHVIGVLVRRLRGGSRGPLDSSEQHVIIETIIALTSAMNSCQTSKLALEGIILQVFSHCKATLETINASAPTFAQFLFGPDLKGCTERRRQLCRELFSLDTITTALVLPPLFGDCLTGGFVKPAVVQDAARHRSNFLTRHPLIFDSSKQYQDLYLTLDAPQALYAEALLPLLVGLLTRIVELYSTRCNPDACHCSTPLRCAALNTATEDDVAAVQTATKRHRTPQETWRSAGVPDVAAQDMQNVIASQNNLRALFHIAIKLLSSVLKISGGIALYKASDGDTLSLQALDLYRELLQNQVPRWLSAPGLPAQMQTAIIEKVLQNGLLFPFQAVGLPSNTTEILPVVAEPFCLLMPTPETVGFYATLFDVFTQGGVARGCVELCAAAWAQALQAAQSANEFEAELRRIHATQLLSATTQLFSGFFNVSQTVSSKGAAADDLGVTGPGALLSELSRCTTSSLRAMMHVHLLKEVYGRAASTRALIEQVLQLISFPVAEVILAAHACLRNYARLAWKRIGGPLSGQDKQELRTFLDAHSVILNVTFAQVINFGLIVNASPPIKDDPFAADVVPEPELLKTFPSLPPTLIHHIFNGKSSSSGCQVFRAVTHSPADQTFEIMWTAEDATSLFAWTVVTLYDLMKAGVQLFALRCVHLVLKKTPGHQLKSAELLSSVQFDPQFKQMVLQMADTARFSYTLDADGLVEWVSMLYQQKDSRQVKENMKQFMLGNLEEVS